MFEYVDFDGTIKQYHNATVNRYESIEFLLDSEQISMLNQLFLKCKILIIGNEWEVAIDLIEFCNELIDNVIAKNN